MFHRVKTTEEKAESSQNSEKDNVSVSSPESEATATQSPAQNATIKPNSNVRMAQSAAIDAAQTKVATPPTIPPTQPQPYAQKPNPSFQRTVQKFEDTQEEPTNKQKETKKMSSPQTATASNPSKPAAEEKKPSPAQRTPANYAGYSVATENESRLTIGRGITMSGEIESCDHLLVEGTVEAALKGARVLEISESGTFFGAVDIQEAEIAGRFEGDLNCYGRLVVRATGTVTGTISYKELEVEAGAVIEGRLLPIASDNNEQSEAPATRSAAPKTREVRVEEGQNLQAANSDSDLFSDKGFKTAQ